MTIVDAHGRPYTPPSSGLSSGRGAARREPLLASMRHAKMREAMNGWRGVSGGTPLYLGPQEIMLMRSYWMYFTSDIIGGMIDKLVGIMVGNGFAFKSADPAVSEAIDLFWEDPVNDFPWQEDALAVESYIYGEMIFSLFPAPTGDVRISTVDPYDVEYTIPDTRNRHLIAGVKLKDVGRGAEILKTVIAPGIPDEAIFSKETVAQRKEMSTADGPVECYYFPFNRRFVRDGSPFGYPYLRGTPDFLAAMDPAEDTDDILFAMRRRADVASRVVWDVTIDDAGQSEVDDFLQNTPLPDEYALNVHNAKVHWNVITPELKASEHETQYRMFRNHTISARKGLPPTWFGDGTDANRASAQEMPFPTLKTILMRQRKLSQVYKRLVSYALYHKGLPHGMADFDVVLPTISEKDLERITNALSRLTATLTQAEVQTYCTKDEARDIWRSGVEDLGYELGEFEPQPESYVTEEYENYNELRNGTNGGHTDANQKTDNKEIG